MPNKRLHQIAKEYNISSDALLSVLREMGFTIKSHMSIADYKMLKAIAEKFRVEKEDIKKEIALKRKKQEERTQREKAKAEEIEKEKVKEAEKEKPAGTNEIVEVLDLEEVKEKEVLKDLKLKKKEHILKGERKLADFKKRKDKPEKDKTYDVKEIEDSVKKTLSLLDTLKTGKKYKKKEKEETTEQVESKTIKVSEFISVAELAALMNLKPAQVIAKCLELGLMASINQRLDMDTIGTIALEFGFSVEKETEVGAVDEEQEEAGEQIPRPPVVTIMGHVDHGKTSLLDYIRKSNIIAGEAGGITQHIGAYAVELPKGKITFLDTPGHEAFTAMRARGVQATDIVVLVVAADDGVKPQTIEAIDHAKAGGVPIIVAINKIDLPGANPDSIRQQLSKYNLMSEEWGGKTIFVEVSAKKGTEIERLLEMILLQAEMLELKANANTKATGVVIESRLDRGKGPLATVLIQKGTLKNGDPIVAGIYSGKVRALLDERGHLLRDVGPATPAQVLGLGGVPQAGDTFFVAKSEQEAREISAKRARLKREQQLRQIKHVTLDEIYERIKEGQIKELKLVIKGDVDGSVEVLSDTLEKISNSEVKVNVIHKGVGAINESDVLLASASDAIIIGFHVQPNFGARELANQNKVDLRVYQTIYEVENDIKKALEGLLEPETIEKITGTVEVRELFRVPKVGVVAGSFVQSGVIKKVDRIRVIRDGTVAYEGTIGSLRRFNDDVKEVENGLECGIRIENYNDVKVGDIIEAYQVTKLARKLEKV
ncbi:MAG TPA: translation initiation factor IF-2 [candidate division Zixibacteria bacterium]|nr:translation initiation factor IF-2 [candidate division Zixibacteria bacterium]